MPEVKYLFGEIETDESIPPIETIEDNLRVNALDGETGNEYGVPIDTSEDYYAVHEDDYIFIKFVKVVSEEQQVVEDGEMTIGENTPARVMRFLLTREGDYVYESTSGVYDDDALEFLIGDDSFEIDFECKRYSQFTPDQMQAFYNDAFRVRGLKFDNIGGNDNEDSVDEDVRGYIQGTEDITGAAGQVLWGEFSTGNKDNNLTASDIIDGFGTLSNIKKLRMKDSEGNIQKVNRNGRYTFSYPADSDISDLADRTYGLVGAYTNNMIEEDEEEE